MRRHEQSPQAAPAINRDAWLAALKDVSQVEVADEYPDAITVVEFAALTGLGRDQANRRLQQMVERGRAERVRKRQVCSDGGVRPVPAYRLKDTVPPAATRASRKKA